MIYILLYSLYLASKMHKCCLIVDSFTVYMENSAFLKTNCRSGLISDKIINRNFQFVAGSMPLTLLYNNFMSSNKQTVHKFAFKDARSVSLYPYNQSQILQQVKYTNKLTLQKELQNVVTNNVFLEKKKHQQNQNKSNIKTLAAAGN